MAATTVTVLPLRAAAARLGSLGVSTDTLRERLRRGPTPGRKVDGSWRVAVPDTAEPVADGVPAGDSPGPVQDEQDAPQSPQNGALARQRAEDMAAFTERLVGPLFSRRSAHAEQI